MHDPMTVAFEIKNYLKPGKRTYFKDGSSYVYRESLITIWHNDPNISGDDDSCWFGNRLEKEINSYTRKVGTIQYDPTKDPTIKEHSGYAMRQYLNTKWYNRKYPWKWHFWHWSFQIIPWQKFYKWAFKRCHYCKKGFAYGESGVSDWNGNNLWHMRCDQSSKPATT